MSEEKNNVKVLFSIKKICNYLFILIDWVIEKRKFFFILISILFLILSYMFVLQYSYSNRSLGFLFATLLPIIYLFYFAIKKERAISSVEGVLILFLTILIGVGPTYLKGETKAWNELIKSKIKRMSEGGAGKKGIYGIFDTDSAATPGIMVGTITPKIDKEADSKTNIEITESVIQSIVLQEATNNLIRNGNFQIPLANNLSHWGHGYYSDRIRKQYPETSIIWINFLNAGINISREETGIGNALKIVRKSPREDHVVGIMEQSIKVVPGEYNLSFMAKAKDLEERALQIRTTNDWRRTQTNGYVRGYDFEATGTFGWQSFFENLTIAESGEITFTIVSTGKGTLYLRDISLIKISDLVVENDSSE